MQHAGHKSGGGGGGGSGGGGGNGGVDRTNIRAATRHHSSPRLQHQHQRLQHQQHVTLDEPFRGGQQPLQSQHHGHHQHHPEHLQHHHRHLQQQHSRHHQQQHSRHHQQQHQHHRQSQPHHRYLHHHSADVHGLHAGYGAVGLPRAPPPLMSAHTEPMPSRGTKGGARGSGGSVSRAVATDFSQLPSSPEHNMGLKAHAAEFVPGKGGGSSTAGAGGASRSGKRGKGAAPTAAKAAPNSDLTAFAREFVPGASGGGGGVADATQSVDAASGRDHDAATQGSTGKMVQVVRGGTIYFVPESEALATDELVGGENYEPAEEGFLWTHDSAALASPQRRTMHSTAIPEHLWAEFQSQSLSVLQQLPPDDERLKEIPPQFYAVFPLDSASKTRGTAGSFGYPSETYKVVQHHNGQAYALRRFDTVRTTPKIVSMGMEIWLSMPEHPAITRPREAFIHRSALFFVCDFHPGAETLAERFIDKQGGLLSETLIWRLVGQLLGALRAAHAAGTPIRNIHPSRVLYCRVGDRARVNWVGCLNVLEFETRKQVADLQQQDMFDLGNLILALACRHRVSAGTRGESVAFMAQHYSPELHNLVVSLISKPPTVFDVCMATAHHTMDAFESTLMANSALQSHLSNEYDNGRLLRLLLKLGTLNERPDQGGGEWGETGERYILKLFRDYCFHQVDSDGEPVMDFGHIYQTLARLDAGDEEKIVLTSRDKRSLLVVSFADVKRCLDEAFAEVAGQAGHAPATPGGSGIDGGMGMDGRGGSGLGSRSSAANRGAMGHPGAVRGMVMDPGAMHAGVSRRGIVGGGAGGLVHGSVPMGHGPRHSHGIPVGMVAHPGPMPY